MSAETIIKHFERTTESFFSQEEFRKKLRSGKKLRIKYGVDVTAPLLHTGHAVNLWLMRYLQNLGHKVIFLIGDFTTRIGDPTGRNDQRPVIPRDEIEKNAEAFIQQARMVLRFDDPALIEVRRNSEWFDKMTAQELMNLLSMVTHARLISRDMFQKRIDEDKDIYMHEMLYPVLQGYDSVAVKSDLTIIGSDQLFNEMMGRFFQEKTGQAPQTIITTKITPGIDGKAKQSKSLGNFIGLGHSPRDKFGRVMSIPDHLISEYFRIYTDVPLDEIERMSGEIEKRPREAKIKLAYALVGRYHGHEIAVWEREWFENTISKGLVPDDIPVLPVDRSEISVLDLVKLTRPDKSKADTRRLIKQGGVELNGGKLLAPDDIVFIKTNDTLKVGKRNWYRIEIVGPNELETENLWLKPLELEDIDLIKSFIPEWEIVKYLTRPFFAKESESIAREVLKRVIFQPEPKDEWLWKIESKTQPGKIIGVAHLRTDPKHGNHNIWLSEEYRGGELTEEALMAVNEHAFSHLGFNKMLFNKAFAHAAAPQEMEVLRKRFMALDSSVRNREDPEGSWGFTKEGWNLLKQRIRQVTPEVKSLMTESNTTKKNRERFRGLREAGQKPPDTKAPAVNPAPDRPFSPLSPPKPSPKGK